MLANKETKRNLKRWLVMVVVFVVGSWVCESAAYGQYGGGAGEPNDPYLIYTAGQMNAIGANPNDWDKHFKLMADIDLSGYTGTAFNIIGSSGTPFTGSFDGNDHTISNFTYTSTETRYYIGLFGYVSGANAEIKDVGLINPDVDAGTGGYVGSLVGMLSNGTITDCYAEGGSISGDGLVGGLVGRNESTITNSYSTASVSGNSDVGGLVGYNGRGTITNSYSTGSVSGHGPVGGLVGDNGRGTITNSYSTGSVSGHGSVGGLVGENDETITNCYSTGSVSGGGSVGGLVGSNRGWGTGGTITNCYSRSSVRGRMRVGSLVGDNYYGAITNCYATGDVSGDERVGGLVGQNYYWSTITNCYATGAVTGDSDVGGLVGWNQGEVTASFWDIETSGQATSAGGTGLPTAGMHTASTFIGWGCGSVWTLDEGNDYPRLLWENMPGDLFPQLSDFLAGAGTQSDPYMIYTADELNMVGLFSCERDKHFKLMADIDLSTYTGTSFNIIGTNWGNAFTGVFDGNGHTISNFTYSSTDADYIGLFGYVSGADAEIKDVGLIDPDVDAGTGGYVGSLVGRLSNGTITDCYAEGGSISGHGLVGGLVGINGGTITNCYSEADVSGSGDWGVVGGLVGYNEATITNCYSAGSVEGDSEVGGLVGSNYGTITDCYASGSVSGGSEVGGLVGWNYYGTITNCYASGSVSGNSRVGGLVGQNGFYDPDPSGWGGEYYPGWISNCYSTGSVEGNYSVGGLLGVNEAGGITNSFWDTETSGQMSSDGGTSKTTVEMQTASTFFGWGCGSVWTLDEGNDYPRLLWENMPGDLFPQLSDFLAGAGTQSDPYMIYTADELNMVGLFSCERDKHFKLMADIDLNGYTGTSFNIIGTDWDNAFTGVFDGNGHTISNFTYDSNGTNYIGLFGYVADPNAEVKDLRLIDPNVAAGTGYNVGSLVGYLGEGTVTGCYVEASGVSGGSEVGGLVGLNWGTITNCYSTGSVSGGGNVGGLVGYNSRGTISNCYSTGSVSGGSNVGGLVGKNGDFICWQVGWTYRCRAINGTIFNCYSTASVSGNSTVGGLVGYNYNGPITNCYSAGSVSGESSVGGLVGYGGEVTDSFWDTGTSGQMSSDGGMGLTTAEMQMESTFTDAGWDFITPIWTIDEGVDYPRLWWETVPVLHSEPEVTLGTSNTISWDPVPGASEYYAECAEDANFTSILYSSGWITETSYEFTGLELGQEYWYSVKARNIAGMESDWSNVESSLQATLADAVELMLEPNSLKNKNTKKALIKKINAVLKMIDEGLYDEALDKLENDILQKMNGCAETGEPDRNDWIRTCEGQSLVYPLIIETIEDVWSLMGGVYIGPDCPGPYCDDWPDNPCDSPWVICW